MIGTVARTLAEIQDNPIVRAATDRSHSIKPVINEALKAWQINLDKRHPAPVYIEREDGEPIYRGTDFDLFTVLMALRERRAVINIPSYSILTPLVLHSNQRLVSKENRHGQVLNLISREETNAFSVRIRDFNVVETVGGREEVGTFRSFAIVDPYGNWYVNSGTIEFRGIPEEIEFFEKYGLTTLKGSIPFRNFVHPNLVFAFFGSRYNAMKIVDQRTDEQIWFYRKLAKHLRKGGVKLPASTYIDNEEEKPTQKTVGAAQGIEVATIEARISLPPFRGAYPLHSLDENGKITETYDILPKDDKKALQGILRYSERVARELARMRTPVRAVTRAVELAFYRSGFKRGHALEPGYETRPSWDIPPWVRNYQEISRGRRLPIRWNALPFNDYVSLLYRVRKGLVDVREGLFLREDIRRYEGAEAILV